MTTPALYHEYDFLFTSNRIFLFGCTLNSWSILVLECQSAPLSFQCNVVADNRSANFFCFALLRYVAGRLWFPEPGRQCNYRETRSIKIPQRRSNPNMERTVLPEPLCWNLDTVFMCWPSQQSVLFIECMCCTFSVTRLVRSRHLRGGDPLFEGQLVRVTETTLCSARGMIQGNIHHRILVLKH